MKRNKKLLRNLQETGSLDRLTGSGRRAFWTYFVTISLFSLYLMNFVFHTMLDAAGELVLRVHYKSMKCDVSFSHGSVSTIFRWGGHFSCMYKNFFLFSTVQNYNKKLIRRWDSERELSLRRHRRPTCTTKYNRIEHKFRHRSTRLCVGTQVYQI